MLSGFRDRNWPFVALLPVVLAGYLEQVRGRWFMVPEGLRRARFAVSSFAHGYHGGFGLNNLVPGRNLTALPFSLDRRDSIDSARGVSARERF